MVSWLLALVLAAAPPASAATSVRPSANRGGGEVLLDAAGPLRPPSRLHVHGEARLALAFGHVAEDPMAQLQPSILLDLRELAPVRLGLSAPIRLRMADRAPADRGVIRRRDWDEVGDVLAILSLVEYRDDFSVSRGARVHVDVTVGRQDDLVLGHGSLVGGFANSLDIDRRRSGILLATGVRGRMLDKPAEAALTIAAGDLAGSSLLAAELATRWAGAGIAGLVVGDPTAPRELARTGDPEALALGRGNRPRAVGTRGMVAGALELSYQATDEWRWQAGPHVDLVQLAGLGRGVHVGGDGEVRLGPRRGVTLGGRAELTVGSSGYDPAYFGVFYAVERWQMPFASTPERTPAEFAASAAPKFAFVRDRVPAGVGGMGALRFRHRAGASVRAEYRMRPGPLGHSFGVVGGVELRKVGVFARFAHRGDRHGFEPELAGTLAALELRVPTTRWLDVELHAAWTFGVRIDTRADGATGALVTGAGTVLGGVTGKIPW